MSQLCLLDYFVDWNIKLVVVNCAVGYGSVSRVWLTETDVESNITRFSHPKLASRPEMVCVENVAN